MVDISEAEKIVLENLPGGRIAKHIEYKNLFVFQVFRDDPLEGDWDPFYSVNRDTKEFSDFSIILAGDLNELTQLFMSAEERRTQ